MEKNLIHDDFVMKDRPLCSELSGVNCGGHRPWLPTWVRGMWILQPLSLSQLWLSHPALSLLPLGKAQVPLQSFPTLLPPWLQVGGR